MLKIFWRLQAKTNVFAMYTMAQAPTAGNEQLVVFAQDEVSGSVSAHITTVKSGEEYTNLGIVKLHFELSAQQAGISADNWIWGLG